MKTIAVGTGLAGLLLAGLIVNNAAAQGALTPPGSPAPTMHTLEEIYQRLGVLETSQADMKARLEAAGMGEVPLGMVLIPAGEFVMGDSFGEGFSWELPLHTNRISAFWMDQTEVTKFKWDQVYGWATNNGYAFDNPGLGKATNHPVHTVNWHDCAKWANARSEMEGLPVCYLAETDTGTVYRAGTLVPTCDWYANGYRLPTEAEWERAARAGVQGTRFPWTAVNTIQHARANYYASPGSPVYDTSPTTGYYPGSTSGGAPYTIPVGTLAPNGYGLYNMAGNVYEWCWDWYSPTYYTSSPSTDPHGPESGTNRMMRGGTWNGLASVARIARRTDHSPTNGYNLAGFRLVRRAP